MCYYIFSAFLNIMNSSEISGSFIQVFMFDAPGFYRDYDNTQFHRQSRV
jgi:hypothetical protein